ncbi:MAG: hypothetical protein ACLP1X_13180 [Polyangiaceae bacterium]
MSRRWLAAATFVALVLACASPTLPLPPPEAPSVEVVDAEHVTLTAGCGGALALAYISILNQGPNGNGDPTDGGQYGSIAQATSCGSWSITVFARANDTLVITQSSDNVTSLPTDVLVQ